MGVAHYVCLHQPIGAGRYVVLHGYVFDDETDKKADIAIGPGHVENGAVLLDSVDHHWTQVVNALGVGELRGRGVPVEMATNLIRDARRWFTTPPRTTHR
ncbi:MAG TPA: hypothetical protein VHC20_01640 [Candidatus Paceibacterota bacterium]|nr:hypothetical protein [Candidatus Paceibacterota bacterium]